MSSTYSEGMRVGVAVSIVLMVISIGLFLFGLGRSSLNRMETSIATPINAMGEDNAFYLATYAKPVPVASIWKVIQQIGAANVTEFSIKKINPTNPNDYILVSEDIADIFSYMADKASLIYELDRDSGLYSMEVRILT